MLRKIVFSSVFPPVFTAGNAEGDSLRDHRVRQAMTGAFLSQASILTKFSEKSVVSNHSKPESQFYLAVIELYYL
jgi:hypothetical protein